MFYSVDILNPRNGKFGIIWLAAHGRLSTEEGLKKKRKANLRKVLQVDLNRSCKEILNYLRGAIPAGSAREDRSRFSLYLSTMITSGVTYIFNRQVKALLDEILSPRSVQCPPFQPAGNIDCTIKPKPKQLALKSVAADASDNELGFGQVADENTPDASGPRGPGFQVADKSDGSYDISAQLTGEALIDWLLSEEPLPELGEIIFPAENVVPEAMITLKEVDLIPRVVDFEDCFGDELIFQQIEDIRVEVPQEQDPILQEEGQVLDDANLEVIAAAAVPTEGEAAAGLRRSHSPDLESRKRAKLDKEEPEPVDAGAGNLPLEPEPLETVPEASAAAQNLAEPASVYEAEPAEPEVPVRPEMILEPLNPEQLPLAKQKGAKKRSRLIIDKNIVYPSQVIAKWRGEYQSTMRVLVPSDDYALNLHEGTPGYLMVHPGRKSQSSQLRSLFKRNLVVTPNLNETFDEIIAHETESVPIEEETPAVEISVPAIQVEGQIPETETVVAADKDQATALDEAPVSVTDVQNNPAAEDLQMEGFLDAADMLQTSVARKRASSITGSIASISNTPRVSNVNDAPPAARLLPAAALEVLREVSAELRASTAMSGRGSPPNFNQAPLAVPAGIPEESEISAQVENIDISIPPNVAVPDGNLEVMELPERRPAAVSSPGRIRTPVPTGDELLAMIRLYFLDNGLDSRDRITFRQLVPPTRFIRAEAARLFVNLLDLMKKGFIKLDQPDLEEDIFILLGRP